MSSIPCGVCFRPLTVSNNQPKGILCACLDRLCLSLVKHFSTKDTDLESIFRFINNFF